MCAAKILHSSESSQLHPCPVFVHGPMESGLSAVIDVDCTTLMGLDVIPKAILKKLLVEICRASDVSNSVT